MKFNKISTIFFSLAAYQFGIVVHCILPNTASTIGSILTILAISIQYTNAEKSKGEIEETKND